MRNKAKSWRATQYKANKNCHYCNKEMLFLNFINNRETPHPLTATIHYVYNARSYERRTGDDSKVLACYECNQKKMKEFKRNNFLNKVTEFGLELDYCD